jgi:hypothetical protein
MNRYQQRRPMPSKQETVQSATARLLQLLVGCSDHALAAMSANYLANTHRVPVAKCQELLREQRAHRARLV